jgi:TfoX/Sxy family transcriptional regulator of competence genes
MPSHPDYIEFVCEQIRSTGDIRYRKMFGEYMIYLNNKPLFLVCDNTVYVKMFAEIENLMRDASKGYPYTGAREHYILDIDNREFCETVISIIEPLLQLPKPKKKRLIR